jgi:IS30 family transposase
LKQSTNLRSIHERPLRVEARRHIGHWEGDLIIGAGLRSAIATLVERKTRYTILVPLRGGHGAQLVGDRLIETLGSLPAGLRRTLTWDQGNEMFQHERIEAATGIRIYFADPHSPWQRGTNENTNGLLRQYFPKGTDLDQFSDHHLAQVAAELNNRPRLCLDDRSPSRLMQRWVSHTDIR